jgi:hypothetical protein
MLQMQNSFGEGIGRLNVRLSAPKMKIVDRVKKALA